MKREKREIEVPQEYVDEKVAKVSLVYRENLALLANLERRGTLDP